MSEYTKVLDALEGLADTTDAVLPAQTDAEREQMESIRAQLAAARRVHELIDQRDDLLFALEQIVNALPERRDWLDPLVEKVARAAIAKVRNP